ncbi:MAG: nuclear transport factor 2 family protein [bacterium]|nr:nuclear transport factor 2 family protein [bacterium]
MRKITLLVLFISIVISMVSALVAGNPDPNAAKIRSVMDRQVREWNNGNIDGFMAGYWKSEQFTFQSGNKRLTGWNQLIAMYKKNYAGAKMGKLTFKDIKIKSLSPDIYLTLGRWQVAGKEETKEGLFTLVFRRIDKQWKIIHDHSS